MAAEGASKRKKNKKPTETAPDNGKRILIAGTVLILVAALGTFVVVIAGPSNESAACQAIRQAMAQGRDYSKGYGVTEINECERDFDCTFDILTCDIPCPLGFKTDKHRCVISCECASHSMGTFQGDLQFDDTDVNGLLMRYGHASIEETFAVFSSSVRASVLLWPKAPDGRAKVPYTLDSRLESQASLFQEAFSMYREKTCVDFVPRTGEEDYVTFVHEFGCWSHVGRREGQQPCSVSDSCLTVGILLHELMHAIGFDHEHVRPDRDGFILVNIPAVDPGQLINFGKIREPVKNLGRPYDYDSVTHISSKAWAVEPYEYSFTKQGGSHVIGQRDHLSTEDVKEINILYGCDTQHGGVQRPPAHAQTTGGGVSHGQPGTANAGMPGGGSQTAADTSPPHQEEAWVHQAPGMGPVSGDASVTAGASIDGDGIGPGTHSGTVGFAPEVSTVTVGESVDGGVSGPGTASVTEGGASATGGNFDGSQTTDTSQPHQEDASFAPGMGTNDASASGIDSVAGISTAPGGDSSATGGTTSGAVSLDGDGAGSASIDGDGGQGAASATGAGDELTTGGIVVEQEQQPPGVSWTEWVPWSNCVDTCGLSEHFRFRQCTRKDGTPAYGCIGEWYQVRLCHGDPCPEKSGKWAEWQPWESCSRTCNLGYQWRKRKCPKGSERCPGYAINGRHCWKTPCPERRRRDTSFDAKKLSIPMSSTP